jgi:ribosome-binding factor A
LLEEVADPRLRDVAVSDVRMSPDLRTARVFVRRLGRDADPRDVLRALGRAANFLRSRVGEALQLRYVPELRFEYDHLIDRAERVERLLADLKAKEDPS